MLLIQDPVLMMLDEPVAGMSVAEREQTAELLERICKGRARDRRRARHGVRRSIAHRVTVLHQGKWLAEGSMDAVQNNPQGRSRSTLAIEAPSTQATIEHCCDVDNLSVGYGQSQVIHGI